MRTRCKAMTQKGKQCSILSDPGRDGYCHAHDPLGKCQKNLRNNRPASKRVKPALQPRTVKSTRSRENRIPADVYRMYFDGGGPLGVRATYGWVIKRDKSILSKGSGVAMLGPGSTNNIAEWTALIMGLDAARGLAPLWVMGDSKLVINQASGKWRCKAATMRALYDIAKPLLAGVNKWRWVPRDENFEADALCYSGRGEPLFVYEDLAGFDELSYATQG